MAKLILKFKDEVIKEHVMAGRETKIGRNPDNDITIENPAVSKYHARVDFVEGRYILTDLNSTNGTFVNENKVKKLEIRAGDNIIIGKHIITFEQNEASLDSTSFADIGGATMILNTKQQKELLSRQQKKTPLKKEEKNAKLIIVQSGIRKEYTLTGDRTLIGKSPTCDVILDGFMVPQIAATIKKEDEHYFISGYGGWVSVIVNGKPAGTNQRLYKNNIIQIRKFKMVFKE